MSVFALNVVGFEDHDYQEAWGDNILYDDSQQLNWTATTNMDIKATGDSNVVNHWLLYCTVLTWHSYFPSSLAETYLIWNFVGGFNSLTLIVAPHIEWKK